MYVIELSDGDYVQQRGGWDWGRSGRSGATTWSDLAQAHAWAAYTRGWVVHAW
jgi:hypothetical protein